MDPNELHTLWHEYYVSKEIAVRDALIVHYLYLVKLTVGRVAAGLPSYIKTDDLYSSGVTGLIRAVEKFDPSMNNKFETYASFVIKGAIIDELRELDWVPRSVHQKANQIATAREDLHRQLGREPADGEIAEHLGISKEEFGVTLNRIRPAILIPLNADLDYYHEDATPLSERIPDEKAETSYDAANRKECQGLLESAINTLPEQEKRVLIHYYFDEMMLKEIGKVLGISESRVSQIHTKALLKLRKQLAKRLTSEK